MSKFNEILMLNIMKKSYFRYAVVLLLSMLLAPLSLQAQNVTIGPNNGSLITGQAGGNVDDSGIKRGMASMWRHEQLSLMMTTSDIANLTGAGELQDPSCAIDVYNGNLIIGAGQTQTFMVVSLPKGYRITGYRLVLQPNISGTIQLHPGKDSWNIGTNDQLSFYETPAWSSGSPYGNNTHSTQLNCPDAIATAHEIGNESNTVMRNDSEANRAREFVIERTSMTPDDMTNQLHFFFARGSSEYAVTIKSFELRFTAQGTFTAEVLPIKSGESTDYITSPFATSKMDVGKIVEKNGLYTYDYTTVRDLIAYTHLYQDNAISGGIPSHKSDGPKNIHPVEVDGEESFAFGNDTYFIEPPVTMNTASGIKDQPIGYRIVGAKFDYKWGTKTEATTNQVPTQCQITCRGGNTDSAGNPGSLSTNGRTTYYLNSYLMFTTTPYTWEMDDLGNIGIGLDTEYPQFLSCFGEGASRQLSLGSSANGDAAQWNLRRAADGSLYYYSDGGNSYRLYAARFQEGSPYHTRGVVTTGNLPNNCVWVSSTTSENGTVSIPAFNPGGYTLKIYGTDKDTPIQTIEVNGPEDVGSYTTPKLNNDAVKFSIEGLTEDDPATTDVDESTLALVNVTLQMEALNPYINKMDIVCESEEDPDTHKKLELVQTFTANDFAVSGGKFIFYIPTDYNRHDLTFTFRDLYSQYGDESYGGTGNARCSFVTSPYFQAFDGYAGNATSIEDAGYDMNDATDAGLYDNRYSPEIKSTTKIYTSVAGNIRFKFNNAEDITGGGDDKYLEEYPFSVSKYIGSEDPDGSDKTGEFNQIIMNASKEDQKSGIYYVFTADETRYNIAPTTAWEHRSYAFYRMDIDLVARNYIPRLEWTKVYDQTLYVDKDKDGKEFAAENPMWGLTLRANDTDAAHQQFTVEGGYLSVKEIVDAINGVEGQECDGAAIGEAGAPESMNQVLYIDGSKLLSIVSSAGDYSLQALKDRLAPNGLIYLPENMTSTADNFAYKTSSGAFVAGKNIVLTDRQPFYAPYDIQVDASQKVEYKRQITNDKNGKVASATIILPFNIKVDSEGQHTNADETSPAFSLHQMQATNCLTNVAPEGQEGAEEYVYFPVIQAASATSPNKPYLVKVINPGDDENVSFVASQTGALVKATTSMDAASYTFTGESASGTVSASETAQHGTAGTYQFTAYGSYSGKKVAKDANNVVFYFAKNMFLSTQELNKPYLNVAPFRSYYASVAPTGAKLSTLSIIFGEGEGNADAIRDLRVKEADLAVQAGRGTLTIASKADNNVRVSGINGISRYNLNMKAGDVKTVSVPAGIYVVNGVKILVK